jgi:hypothetical protein
MGSASDKTPAEEIEEAVPKDTPEQNTADDTTEEDSTSTDEDGTSTDEDDTSTDEDSTDKESPKVKVPQKAKKKARRCGLAVCRTRLGLTAYACRCRR